MKQRLKGLLALVLSLVMVFALATNAWAAVKIGGVEVEADKHWKYDQNSGNMWTQGDADNYNVYLKNGTLTLNDFTVDIGGGSPAISSDQPLTINLIGSNSVTGSYAGDSGNVNAISVDGALTIEGTGSLTASGTKSGIESTGDLTISGATVNAKGYVYGIYSHNTTTFTGGEVEATGRNSGILADKVTISGGTVTAGSATDNGSGDVTYNSSFGIKADSSISITGGTVTATGSDAIAINEHTTTGTISISGATTTVTANGGNSGIYAKGSVSITGGSVIATATEDVGWGIYGGSNVTIKDGAKVVAKAGDNGIGIGTIYSTASASSANTIVISGEGTEVEAGCKTGLSAFTVNILENSTVTITTNATAPAVGKAIDATTLNFGSNWYQWSTNNPGETTPISSETKAFALNNYGGTGQNPAPTSLTIGKITYTVTFDANGHGTAPTAQTVASGATASEPTAPTADGWTFGGWYKEAGCSNAFDFNTAITGNITLYAKWTENSGGVPGNQQPSYNYPIYIPTVEDEPEVTAPKTFDGGIASAVVVTILSATGGAWLAKKKD